MPAHQINANRVMREEWKDISDNSHIYLICKTPSLAFDPEDFSFDKEKCMVSGSIIYRKKGVINRVQFSARIELIEGAVDVKLDDYPHREFKTVKADGEFVFYYPAILVLMENELHIGNKDLYCYEVVYIGQSFGKGDRSAIDRLRSHSTFQKILAETQYNNPDHEIVLMGFEYEDVRMIIHMDGQNKAQNKGDGGRFFSIRNNPPTEQQVISLVEAALIRYFQPDYNVIYKNNFPDNTYKILEACYKLDFSGLIVEIDTSELSITLGSGAAEDSEHHICQYDLVAHENRWSFFHFRDKDGNIESFPGVVSQGNS